MDQRNTLLRMMKEQDGIITTKQASQNGIRKNIFSELIREQSIIKIAHGLYGFPNEEIDKYLYFAHRIPSGIFSHDTALYLHGLTTRTPLIFHMTIMTGSNVSRIKERGKTIEFRYADKETFELGQTTVQSPFGRSIRTYDPERSILDAINHSSSIDSQVFSESLKNYFSSNINLLKLATYAKKMDLTTKLKLYTEVLL